MTKSRGIGRGGARHGAGRRRTRPLPGQIAERARLLALTPADFRAMTLARAAMALDVLSDVMRNDPSGMARVRAAITILRLAYGPSAFSRQS